MQPRIRLIVAAAVIIVLCRAAADQGHATVVKDGSARPANPAVEAGGQPLAATDKRPQYGIPYSLIGALRAQEAWFSPYCGWPWPLLRSFRWYRHHVVDGAGIGPVSRPSRPVP